MKKLIYLFIILLNGMQCFAQIEKPVKWEFALKKTSATEATLYLKATLKESWHIYSLDKQGDGPVKTTFNFEKSPDYTLLGSAIQPKPQSRFEKAFNSNVTFFEGTVIFSQKLRLKSAKGTVRATVEYMTCNDRKCLPPETLKFAIPID